jgi:hypothetical protein
MVLYNQYNRRGIAPHHERTTKVNDLEQYGKILVFVTENGRVAVRRDGRFSRPSLEAEVEFEARERGLSDEQAAEAVAFAIAHTDNA